MKRFELTEKDFNQDALRVLCEQGFEIESTSTQIQNMLQQFYGQTSKTPKPPSQFFKDLKYKFKDSIFIGWDMFVGQLVMIRDKFKPTGINCQDNNDLAIKLLKCSAWNKMQRKKEHQILNEMNAFNIENNSLFGFVNNEQYSFEEINLFETISNIPVNSSDKAFWENFSNTSDGCVIYTYTQDGEKTNIMVFKKLDGSIDFKDSLAEKTNYYKGKTLYDIIEADIGVKYSSWIDAIRTKIRAFTHEDLSTGFINPNGNGYHNIIDSLFIGGFDFNGTHYVVPTFFAKLLKFYLIIKHEKTEDGKFYKTIVGCKIEPKSTGKYRSESLMFGDMFDVFCQRYPELSRNCVKTTPNMIGFQNTVDRPAYNYWNLPSEEVWKTAVLPENWTKFWKGKATPRILERVFCYLGMVQDANNQAQQCLLIVDAGGTGKQEIVRLLTDIFGQSFVKDAKNEYLCEKSSFGITTSKLYNAHLICVSEYDGHSLDDDQFKKVTGGAEIPCDVKGGQAITWYTRGTKFILCSNRTCNFSEHAVRRRVLPASFKINFTEEMTFEEHEALVANGREFLNFCYRCYKTSPFMENGKYKVLNPEQEKLWLNPETKELLKDPEKAQIVLAKAFEYDPDLCQEKIKNGRYDGCKTNELFHEVFEQVFDFTGSEKDYISAKEMNFVIAEWIMQNPFRISNYQDLLNIDRVDIVDPEFSEFHYMIYNRKKNMNTGWSDFLKETMYVKYQSIRVENTPKKCWIGIKWKDEINNSILKSRNEKQSVLEKGSLTASELAQKILNKEV